MPSYYTYATPVLVDSAINQRTISPSDPEYGSTVDNTGTTTAAYTHADVFITAYTASNQYANLEFTVVFSEDGVNWESFNSSLFITTFSVSFNYSSSNPLRYVVKDIRLLPYKFRVGVRNNGPHAAVVTVKVYGRRYLFVSV